VTAILHTSLAPPPFFTGCKLRPLQV